MNYVRQLGQSMDHGSGFNMTTLAIRGSTYHNGVSRLHGKVSREMCASLWPDVPPEDNPITSITNGVHVTTWLAPEWVNAFDMHLGGRWRGHLLDPEFWEKIQDIPDQFFWSIHQTNKQRMLQHVRELLLRQAKRNGESEEMVRELTSCFDPRTLVIGFARRFATYKRAALLFHDEERLLKILRDVDRPVVFLFAGKAHPADQPGQDLIKKIHQMSRKPEFAGRILMLESYNMSLSRYMLSGVDVWMNNPRRPLEASGTSGMKAAMNGAPNLSVLDGWWPEGYEGDNGWVIGCEHELAEDSLTDEEDALSLYHVLAYDLIPTYYRRNDSGFSEEWVRIAKRAMISSIPNFNTDRMVADYVKLFYVPSSRRAKKLMEKKHKGTREMTAWKAKVKKSWPKVSVKRIDSPDDKEHWSFGETITLGIQVKGNGLSPDEIRVEAVLSRPTRQGGYKKYSVIELEHLGEGNYEANIHPDDTGNFSYRVRIFPTHPDLAHPYSLGLMKWL